MKDEGTCRWGGPSWPRSCWGGGTGLSPGHVAGGWPGVTFDELPAAFGC